MFNDGFFGRSGGRHFSLNNGLRFRSSLIGGSLYDFLDSRCLGFRFLRNLRLRLGLFGPNWCFLCHNGLIDGGQGVFDGCWRLLIRERDRINRLGDLFSGSRYCLDGLGSYILRSSHLSGCILDRSRGVRRSDGYLFTGHIHSSLSGDGHRRGVWSGGLFSGDWLLGYDGCLFCDDRFFISGGHLFVSDLSHIRGRLCRHRDSLLGDSRRVFLRDRRLLSSRCHLRIAYSSGLDNGGLGHARLWNFGGFSNKFGHCACLLCGLGGRLSLLVGLDNSSSHIDEGRLDSLRCRGIFLRKSINSRAR